MKQFILLCMLFCTCNIILQAQNKNNSSTEGQKKQIFSTTSSGLQYKIIKDSVGGIHPEAGGYITFWFEMRTYKDSIFDSQFSDVNPVGIPTPTVKYKPGIEEGFLLLTQGDSAVFLLDADSLYLNSFKREAPSYITGNRIIQMIVKMDKVYSKHFVDSVMAVVATQEAEVKSTYERDSIVIQKYLKEHKLKGEAIDGGVYIVKLKAGKKKDPYIVRVETVETTYVGKLLIEGTEFDRSAAGTYFQFTVGIGEVIKGWDYAFQRLKLGEKALILIPSGLAYGAKGAGDAIPPNAPLLFEVEIKK
jgi:FKBP-type peptidyl-prolyl cis-trans isomerase FkpA